MSSAATRIVRCAHCGRANRVPDAASGTPRCGHCHRPLPWVVDADDTRFATVVEGATVPVLVDVWAPWCGPCLMVSPALDHLALRHDGDVKLVRVNADESPALSQRFEIQAIPTLLVLQGTVVVARRTGAAPEAALAAWLDRALASIGHAHGAAG